MSHLMEFIFSTMIASPNPFIVIELDDENPFLILSDNIDTANFQIENYVSQF